MRLSVLVVVFAFLWVELPLASANEETQVDAPLLVVIADRPTLNRNTRQTVRQQVEKGLADRVGLLSTDTYVRQALNMGYDSTALTDVEAAAAVGSKIKATHVLLLTGKKRRGKRRPPALTATLVDVGSGSWTKISPIRIGRRRMTPPALSRLTATVMRQVQLPKPIPKLSPPPATNTLPTAAANRDLLATTIVTNSTSSPDTSSVDEVVSVHEVATPDQLQRKLGLRITAGAMAFQRDCTIHTGNATDAHRKYNTKSFVPGVALGVEMFPFLLDSDPSTLDDLGLHGRASGTQINSMVKGSDEPPKTSTVWSADGGVNYRINARGWTVAPSMLLRVGYGVVSFPVATAEFPSLSYAGPRGDLRLGVTFAEWVTLFAEVGYVRPLLVGLDATGMGEVATSHAFHGEAGLTFHFGWLEIGAKAQIGKFSVSFKGAADPTHLGVLNDAQIDDQMLGGQTWIGVKL